MTKPLIGITGAVHYTKQNWKFLRAYDANIKAIEAAGGIPVILPCTLQEDNLRELYNRVDGVLLPGGGDVHSDAFGQPLHEKAMMVYRERDEMEYNLSRWAVEDKRPIFGICRGHQVFNVALGGSLIQDIPTQFQTELTHDLSEGMARDTLMHNVTIVGDSLLSKVLGGVEFKVNSIHHQAIDDLAPNLRATGYSPDGLIEATEIVDHPYALTVQWHPEDLVNNDAAMMQLFKSFVNAARINA